MSDQLSLLFDRARAAQAAVDGMEKASRAERVQAWKAEADGILERMPLGMCFTADYIVGLCGLPDTGVAKNNVVGAWFSSKSKAGILRFTGRFQKSTRVIGHGNLQRVWEKML